MTVKRVPTAHDLSNHALKCLAAGRHLGFLDDPWVSETSNMQWGPNVDARAVEYRCDCGRTKYEVIDWDTSEILTYGPQYDGGELPDLRCSQREAKLIWLQRLVAGAERQKRSRSRKGKVTALHA